jgi:hypothetical protein
VFSESYFQTNGCGWPPDILHFFPNRTDFIVGDGCEAARVSISTDTGNLGFVPSYNYSQFPGAPYSRISVAPNLSVMIYLKSYDKKIKISNITDSQSIEISRSFNYINLTFSPDGKVIYGSTDILGLLSIWGIPVEK